MGTWDDKPGKPRKGCTSLALGWLMVAAVALLSRLGRSTGTWGDQPDVKPRRAGRHRKGAGRHQKGCAAMMLALGSLLAALTGGVVLGLVLFTALIAL